MRMECVTTLKLPCSEKFLEDKLLERWLMHRSGEISHKLTSVSQPEALGDGNNFLSFIMRVNLNWDKNKNNELPKSVVVKVACGVDRIQEVMGNEQSGSDVAGVMGDTESFRLIHENECHFYTLFNTEKTKLPIPICYYFQAPTVAGSGFILLEDLSDRGTCVNILDGLTLEQTLSAVEAIAQYHAYSLKTYKNLDGAGTTDALAVEWTEKLNFAGLDIIRNVEHMIPGTYDNMVTNFPQLPSVLSREDFIKMASYNSTLECFTDISGQSYVVVLCHGDLWAPNLLYTKANDGKPTNQLLAIIDWQLAHAGPAGEDLARLMCTSVEADNRRAWEGQVLKHYYSQLIKHLGADWAQHMPYTPEEVQLWYYRTMRFALIDACFTIPLIATKANTCSACMQKLLLRGVAACQDTLGMAEWK